MGNFSTQYFWLVYVCMFFAIFLFSLGVAQIFRLRWQRQEMIKKIRRDRVGEIYLDETNSSAAPEQKTSFFEKVFGKIGSATFPIKSVDYSTLRLKFLQAGVRAYNAPVLFWGLKVIFAVGLPLIFLVIRISILNLVSYHATVLIAVLCALLGFYLPNIWLRQKADKRREKILESLPDALDLLVICVEAGMGLDSAINRVAREMKFSSPVISDELNLMNLELRAGKSRQDALRNLSLRTNLDEINSLTTLLIQTDRFGTSLADALRLYSDSFRTQRYQRAEELAAKLPVKLVFPLVLFIFPALMVVILGPAAITIYQNIFLRIG